HLPLTPTSATPSYPLSLHDALPISDIDEDLERGDRLRTEQHEHSRHAEEGEGHQQRGRGDAVDEDDRRPCRDHPDGEHREDDRLDRKSTRLNSSHVAISYAVFCLKK